MTNQISEEDRKRIDKIAFMEYPISMQSERSRAGEYDVNQGERNILIECLCEERTLANQQLADKDDDYSDLSDSFQKLSKECDEKDRILAEKDQQIGKLNTTILDISKESFSKISRLQEALRDMKDEIELMESVDSDQVTTVKKYLLEEIEQLLK